jgi:hypothetical protein
VLLLYAHAMRTSTERALNHPVTAEWAARFKRLCELEPLVVDCECRSSFESGFACAACSEYRQLLLALTTAFRVKPWDQLRCDYEAPVGLDAREEINWWAEALAEAVEKSRVELLEP